MHARVGSSQPSPNKQMGARTVGRRWREVSQRAPPPIAVEGRGATGGQRLWEGLWEVGWTALPDWSGGGAIWGGVGWRERLEFGRQT